MGRRHYVSKLSVCLCVLAESFSDGLAIDRFLVVNLPCFCVDTVHELLASAAESFHKPDVSSISDFSLSYHLDCSSLLSGFHEDLRFHFSLGITSLMRRFLGPYGPRSLTKHISVRVWTFLFLHLEIVIVTFLLNNWHSRGLFGEDQRRPGKRLYVRTVKHVSWIKRMPWTVANGERW